MCDFLSWTGASSIILLFRMHVNSIQRIALVYVYIRARGRAYVYVAFRFIFCYTILSTTREKDRETRKEDVWYHLNSLFLSFSSWSFPINVRPTDCEYYKSSLSRSSILCVSLDLTRCLATEVKRCSVKDSIVLSVIPRMNFPLVVNWSFQP